MPDTQGWSRRTKTLRRLASYREVIDDFIAKASGRIFKTAGDAVLAEFPSAVDAVRCAIDIQESLRTRNMAYPPSRQMSFRSGFISERLRSYLGNDYFAAGDHKAFALNIGGFTGSSVNQPNEEAARNAALDQCQKRAEAT